MLRSFQNGGQNFKKVKTVSITFLVHSKKFGINQIFFKYYNSPWINLSSSLPLPTNFSGTKSLNSVIVIRLQVPKAKVLDGTAPVFTTSVTCWVFHTAWWKVLHPTTRGWDVDFTEKSVHLRLDKLFRPLSAGWTWLVCWICKIKNYLRRRISVGCTDIFKNLCKSFVVGNNDSSVVIF